MESDNIQKDIIRQQAMYEKELGNKFFNNGQYKEAIEHYTKAIQCDPAEPTILCNRAMAYLKIKEYAKAKIDCDVAVALDPTYVKAIYRRALAYLGMNDIQAARANFLRVLELEPTNRQAQDELKKLDAASAISQPPSTSKEKPVAKVVNREAATKSLIVTPVNEPPATWKAQPMTKITNIQEIRSASKADIPTLPVVSGDFTPAPATEIIEIPPVPSTSFDFFKCWRSLAPKDKGAFGKYFMNIPKEAYKTLFDRLIDPDLLADITEAFRRTVQQDETSLIPVSERLLELSQLERFQVAYAFLDEPQREALKQIVSRVNDDEERKQFGDVLELTSKLKTALEL